MVTAVLSGAPLSKSPSQGPDFGRLLEDFPTATVLSFSADGHSYNVLFAIDTGCKNVSPRSYLRSKS